LQMQKHTVKHPMRAARHALDKHESRVAGLYVRVIESPLLFLKHLTTNLHDSSPDTND